MITSISPEKASLREQLESDVDAWLRAGNKPQQLAHGECGEKPEKTSYGKHKRPLEHDK